MLPAAVVAVAAAISACSTFQPPLDSAVSAATKPPPAADWQYFSGAPIPVRHPVSGQREFQTARHWEILAADVVKGFAEVRAKLPNADAPVFVEPPDLVMPFARAFHGYLVTQLLGRGQRVTLSRAGADRIHYAVQPVIHARGTYDPPPGGFPS